MTPNLPAYALALIGPAQVPCWDEATFVSESLEGMWGKGVYTFPKKGNRPAVVIAINDADVDADGPGGGKNIDPWWEPKTSLLFPNGFSCNSRQFPGVVIPPALRPLGVWIGDFGCAIWKDARGVASIQWFQVYDVGPTRKMGEISLFLGRLLGIIPPNQSDRDAATKGNDVEDLTLMFFCGSGPGRAGTEPGHAVAGPIITSYGQSLYTAFVYPGSVAA
jgi:hypothetical protein